MRVEKSFAMLKKWKVEKLCVGFGGAKSIGGSGSMPRLRAPPDKG